jgi:hypothetical protein
MPGISEFVRQEEEAAAEAKVKTTAPAPEFDNSDVLPTVAKPFNIPVYIESTDGAEDYGTHLFSVLPRVGEIVDLWLDAEGQYLFRVKEVAHGEVDPSTGMGEISLYVERY